MKNKFLKQTVSLLMAMILLTGAIMTPIIANLTDEEPEIILDTSEVNWEELELVDEGDVDEYDEYDVDNLEDEVEDTYSHNYVSISGEDEEVDFVDEIEINEFNDDWWIRPFNIIFQGFLVIPNELLILENGEMATRAELRLRFYYNSAPHNATGNINWHRSTIIRIDDERSAIRTNQMAVPREVIIGSRFGWEPTDLWLGRENLHSSMFEDFSDLLGEGHIFNVPNEILVPGEIGQNHLWGGVNGGCSADWRSMWCRNIPTGWAGFVSNFRINHVHEIDTTDLPSNNIPGGNEYLRLNDRLIRSRGNYYLEGSLILDERNISLTWIEWEVDDNSGLSFGDEIFSIEMYVDNEQTRQRFRVPVEIHEEGVYTITARIQPREWLENFDGAFAQVIVDTGDIYAITDALGRLFSHQSSEYNHELATFAAELSELAYGLSERNITFNNDRISYFLGTRGFHYQTFNYQSETDQVRRQPTDTVAHSIAHQSIMVNGESRNLIVVTIRGTVEEGCILPVLTHVAVCGSVDWHGNRNIGSGDNHQGFQLAMENVLSHLNAYVQNVPELRANSRENIILVTGHSRGGAVANLLANTLNIGRSPNSITNDINFVRRQYVFAYTFGSPESTLIPNQNVPNSNNNIFNIMNTRDKVTTSVRVGDAIPTRVPRPFNFHGRILGSSMPGGGFLGHSMAEVYLPFMRSNTMTCESWRNGRVLSQSWRVMNVRINTDVDVNIYDYNGFLVGQFIDNTAIATGDSDIPIWVDEAGVKHLIFTDEMHTLEFTATDYGVMNYTLDAISIAGNYYSDDKLFQNVRLYPGRQMRSIVGATDDVQDTRLYILENGEIVGEILEDGTEILFVRDISITGDDTRQLTTGAALQLEAIITPTNATNQDVVWSTSHNAVATVDTNGLVSALTAGEAIITATTLDGDLRASITLIVSNATDNQPDLENEMNKPEDDENRDGNANNDGSNNENNNAGDNEDEGDNNSTLPQAGLIAAGSIFIGNIALGAGIITSIIKKKKQS